MGWLLFAFRQTSGCSFHAISGETRPAEQRPIASEKEHDPNSQQRPRPGDFPLMDTRTITSTPSRASRPAVLAEPRARRRTIKLVAMVSSCNFLEMYDFMVFGYYAPWIARAFFPAASEFASLMLSLATFGAGFLMRPVGAIVLGAYMDRRGRRAGLLLTLALMAIGTLSIACMPGYRSIGLAAPALVVLGRLLQGLSAGAGVGGVSVYLSEIATPGNTGFYVSWQSASQQVSVVMAALVGIAVSFLLNAEAVSLWGWRIPFLVGCLLIPALFAMQRTFAETP